VLEATSWQTREVVDAMHQDSGVRITTLEVDGGMTKNGLLMQHQADVLGVPVIRPRVSETTCLGAAYAAGPATGVWNGLDELKSHWREDVAWAPAMAASVRDREYRNWRKAVEKSLGWAEDGDENGDGDGNGWASPSDGARGTRAGMTFRCPEPVRSRRRSGGPRPGPWRAGPHRRGPP
jgi:glycerol kinase